MNTTTTDCKSEDGITVGLIDSMITISRILVGRDWDNDAVKEALKDLRYDKDLAIIFPKLRLRTFNIAHGRFRCNGCSVEMPYRAENSIQDFNHGRYCPLREEL